MTMPPGGMPPPIDDETLSAWADGTLSDAEREAVTAAMTRDPALRERARDLRATVALLRALPQPVPRRTFVLTPEMAAPLRPARMAWFVRLFPTVTAVSAVAAILCLALFLGDLRTNGFRTTRHAATTTSRAIPETAPTNTVAVSVLPRTAATSPAGSVAAGAAAPAAAASSAGSAGGVSSAQGAPPAAAALPAPTATNRPTFAAAAATLAPTTAAAPLAPTATLPPLPTAVAAVRATAVTVGNTAAADNATAATTTTRRVPLALVRTGEIALLLLFLVALAVAVVGWRAKRRP